MGVLHAFFLQLNLTPKICVRVVNLPEATWLNGAKYEPFVFQLSIGDDKAVFLTIPREGWGVKQYSEGVSGVLIFGAQEVKSPWVIQYAFKFESLKWSNTDSYSGQLVGADHIPVESLQRPMLTLR